MSYTSKIKECEFKFENLTNQLNNLKLKSEPDAKLMETINSERNTVYQELVRLRRLQWEEDHERVHFDDER